MKGWRKRLNDKLFRWWKNRRVLKEMGKHETIREMYEMLLANTEAIQVIKNGITDIDGQKEDVVALLEEMVKYAASKTHNINRLAIENERTGDHVYETLKKAEVIEDKVKAISNTQYKMFDIEEAQTRAIEAMSRNIIVLNGLVGQAKKRVRKPKDKKRRKHYGKD
jgi:hypothetical protein